MTKKDYELIARVLNSYSDSTTEVPIGTAVEVLAYAFANALSDANPAFKFKKFIEASGFDASWMDNPEIGGPNQ